MEGSSPFDVTQRKLARDPQLRQLSFMLASSVVRSPASLEPAHLLFGWKT